MRGTELEGHAMLDRLPKRKLMLRKETLTELTNEELARVVGARPTDRCTVTRGTECSACCDHEGGGLS
jgi:hypothetical protein